MNKIRLLIRKIKHRYYGTPYVYDFVKNLKPDDEKTVSIIKFSDVLKRPERQGRIVFASTPFNREGFVYKAFLEEPSLDDFNRYLGIPWCRNLNFETLTEYNGFLVEV